MIEISATPAADEIAAIVAALHATRHTHTQPCRPEPVEGGHELSAWALANRCPDLDMEDLRAGVF